MVPTELLILIIGLACDDDGFTARSIASTSRAFYLCSRPFVYRNIVVYRAPQLKRLFEHILSNPRYASFIQNIFIADETEDLNCSTFQQTLKSLLELISPTLLSLTLLLGPKNKTIGVFQTIFDIPFPLLTSLTLCGDHPIPRSLDMPALRQLHTAGLTKYNAAGCFAPFTSSCPQLLHIRVSMASQHNLTFAISSAFNLPGAPNNLERMCLDSIPLSSEEYPSYSPPFPYLPRELVTLTVKPAAPPMVAFSGCTSLFYNQYINQLKELEPLCPPGKFQLLPAFKRNMWDVECYDVSRAKQDWLDVIRGGMGAWSTFTAVA